MWPIETLKKMLSGVTVNHILFTGDKQVTKIEYCGAIIRRPNSLVNWYDLLGYEIRSDTVEIVNESGSSLGLGYVCDISGITINMDRKATGETQAASEQPAEAVPGEGVSYAGQGKEQKLPDLKGKGGTTVPCVLLCGKTRVSSLQFGYLRLIEGALISDKTETRYEIDSEPTEIRGTDGKIALGYVLDADMKKTIVIRRNIRVQKIDKNGKAVDISVNWSGMIGGQATTDIITAFLDLGQSLTAKYVFGLMCLFGGFIIGKML